MGRGAYQAQLARPVNGVVQGAAGQDRLDPLQLIPIDTAAADDVAGLEGELVGIETGVFSPGQLSGQAVETAVDGAIIAVNADTKDHISASFLG